MGEKRKGGGREESTLVCRGKLLRSHIYWALGIGLGLIEDSPWMMVWCWEGETELAGEHIKLGTPTWSQLRCP